MQKFDTKVQSLKYEVLREVARHEWQGDLLEAVPGIPKRIIPGKTPTMRCCVYKERAILAERVALAMGGDRESDSVIHVIDIACDDCPAGGFDVTDSCRGCLAHRCESVCPRGAISFDRHQKAHIDKSKCVNCGKCAEVCPYSAILDRKRPCENACKIGAISSAEDGSARIDEQKCISCGACVYQCPFGALSDRSFILDAVRMLKAPDARVCAVVAPSIAVQFGYAKLGQVISAIRALGFCAVAEAALGADLTAEAEAAELTEKGFLTSSCCPAFVDYVRGQFPALAEHISSSPSPMAAVARRIKQREPQMKVVFIGPCTAKKTEFQRPEVRPYVDCVLTFEELQALLDSRGIDPAALPETELADASYFGRIFARSGGLASAVSQALRERGLDRDFELKAEVCSGITECRTALFQANIGRLDANFIEGMACTGGCVNGAGCLTHVARGRADIDGYGRQSPHGSIADAVAAFEGSEAKV